MSYRIFFCNLNFWILTKRVVDPWYVGLIEWRCLGLGMGRSKRYWEENMSGYPYFHHYSAISSVKLKWLSKFIYCFRQIFTYLFWVRNVRMAVWPISAATCTGVWCSPSRALTSPPFSIKIVQIRRWPFHAARWSGVSPTQETLSGASDERVNVSD